MDFAPVWRMDPTTIDLLELREQVATDLGSRYVPGDRLEGQTAVRDRVVEIFTCSELEAEHVVDTLIAHGFMRYQEEPGDGTPGAWQLFDR
ncbi:MAG: hypothetical protein EOO73_11370 [Myxococcales bacterium]|nr:MAG: hypothetical protein EOO73_11370 [Myxococcales bacterium]